MTTYEIELTATVEAGGGPESALRILAERLCSMHEHVAATGRVREVEITATGEDEGMTASEKLLGVDHEAMPGRPAWML